MLASCTKNELVRSDVKIASSRGSITTQTSNDGISLRKTDSINIREADVKNLSDVSVSDFEVSSIDSATASRIFHDVSAQGYKLWGRYFADGQFAYAHSVRRYIESNYHLKCGKLFIYGKLTAFSPHYRCASSWSYDVACVLRGENGVLYVIDPRLVTTIVTKDVWIQAHASQNTPITQVVSGESFTPLGATPKGYLVDRNYEYTDVMMDYYADSIGCNCTSRSVL